MICAHLELNLEALLKKLKRIERNLQIILIRTINSLCWKIKFKINLQISYKKNELNLFIFHSVNIDSRDVTHQA